jgi:DNA repair protein RecN (Recombination protein N)
MFLASTNPGSPLAPLAKIASGGELSRFMLAIKVALAGVNSTPTLIFDEVDTGIGGAVADAVGKRLQLLGEHVQILVVTHQPQVAARGNYHLKVQKETQGHSTSTTASVLSLAERKEELARMLAGEHITPEARAAADRLLEISA